MKRNPLLKIFSLSIVFSLTSALCSCTGNPTENTAGPREETSSVHTSERNTDTTDTVSSETDSSEDTMMLLEKNLTLYLDNYMKINHSAGYDCSVWYQGKEIYRRQNGYADVEQKIPYSEDTLLHIYSNTKVIACTAALQLWEKGLFDMEDPLSDYFPEMADVKVQTASGLETPKKGITIRDIFTMTSGIGGPEMYTETAVQFLTETQGNYSMKDLPKYIAKTPLKFHPGEGYCYGISHEILAALVEVLSGKTFGEYLKENIFVPMGMSNTAFDPAQCVSEEVANQYTYKNGLKSEGKENVLIPAVLKESASGGLVSTVDDYVKFLEGLRTYRLLKKETVDMMRKNQLSERELSEYGYAPEYGYGLGVRTVRDDSNPNAVGAFGWFGAAGTFGYTDPENEITVFFGQQMFDVKGVDGSETLMNILRRALGKQTN